LRPTRNVESNWRPFRSRFGPLRLERADRDGIAHAWNTHASGPGEAELPAQGCWSRHPFASVFPPGASAFLGLGWFQRPSLSMALVPRWRYMTEDAKALTRRSAVSAAVVLVALLLFRGLLPWVALGLAAWWIWKAINR